MWIYSLYTFIVIDHNDYKQLNFNTFNNIAVFILIINILLNFNTGKLFYIILGIYYKGSIITNRKEIAKKNLTLLLFQDLPSLIPIIYNSFFQQETVRNPINILVFFKIFSLQ